MTTTFLGVKGFWEKSRAFKESLREAPPEVISAIATNPQIIDIINQYLKRASDTDLEKLSHHLVDFKINKKRSPRKRRVTLARGGGTEPANPVGPDHSGQLLEQALLVAQGFDILLARKTLSEWEKHGIFNHKLIPWHGPKGETEEGMARRFHRAVMLTELEQESAASHRRLSLLALAHTFKGLKKKRWESSPLDMMLEIIYGTTWHENGGEKRKAQLKYHIKAGMRWYDLAEEFGSGVIALPGPGFAHSLYGYNTSRPENMLTILDLSRSLEMRE